MTSWVTTGKSRIGQTYPVCLRQRTPDLRIYETPKSEILPPGRAFLVTCSCARATDTKAHLLIPTTSQR